MRTIKFILLVLIAFAMMLIMAANMAPVDLHIIPQALGIPFFSLQGVPLALVIVLALLIGVVVGLLVEYIREGKHRHRLEEKRKEIARLRAENAQLAERLGADVEEMQLLAS